MRFLALGEEDSYDLAHFEFVMREAARVGARHPDLAPHVSVSLHCEVADILNASHGSSGRIRRSRGSAPTAPPGRRTRKGSA